MPTRTALSRRTWLKTAAAAGVSGWTAPWWTSLLSAAEPRAPAKACILIFLEGGPSQIDTFDPKPGTKHGGPVEAIDTKLSGVKFSQYLPRLAQQADQLAILRTLHSHEGDHERAVSLLQTGYSPNPRLEYPALGSSVARYRGDEMSDVPAYVAIGGGSGAGILGPQFGPFVVDDVTNPAPALTLPEGFEEARMARRLAELQTFNAGFGARFQTPLGTDLTQLTRRADRMRKNSVFQAHDPAEAEPELFERYGGKVNEGELARACLLGRRLVEAGVKFVEITHSGWDTHSDNFTEVESLCASLDAACAGLLDDLRQRGLLDQTLVVCVGEFGRTPEINGDNGRDHFPDVFSALLAGGGLKSGLVLGASSADGTEITDRPITVPDFHATLFTALGLDVKNDYFAPDGRLLKLTNNGTAIKELLGA
jgi:uncharacterized protein (DUF1501 family)